MGLSSTMLGERLLRLCVVLLLRFPLRAIMLLFLNVANIISPDLLFALMMKTMSEKEKKKLNMDKMESMEDFGFILTMDRSQQVRDILKEAQVGEAAPNPVLESLQSRSSVPLLSWAKPASGPSTTT